MRFSRGFLPLALLLAVTAPRAAQERWTLTEELCIDEDGVPYILRARIVRPRGP